MPAYIMTIRRVQSGTLQSTGSIPKGTFDTSGINGFVARNPDHIEVVMDSASEAQVRCLVQTAKAVDMGADTSAIEAEAVAATA